MVQDDFRIEIMNFTELESDNVWYQPDELELLLGNLEELLDKVSA